jgi:hypothetical protein
MDLDRRLHEAGQHWREHQGPALVTPSLGNSNDIAPRQHVRRGLVPAGAAAAAVLIMFAVVSLDGATTGSQGEPAGTTSLPSRPAHSPSPKVSEAASAPPSPAAACVASQLRPSQTSGPAGGAGHTRVLLQNISGRPCQLGGVFPLQGITSSGTTRRLVFPGDSATAYPSPVRPGVVAPGDYGAFWVTTQLGTPPLMTPCADSERFASLVIELSAEQRLQMPWPIGMSNGCLAAESAAGPFPQPVPSIP